MTESRTLRQLLELLGQLAIIPQAESALNNSLQAVHHELREVVLGEIPAFSASGNPHIMPELDQHAREHVTEIFRLFTGGDVGDFAFVGVHACKRAEQRFPLEAMLHAYRCGHKVLSRWLREATAATKPSNPESAVSAVADFAIEYTNLISTIAASQYVAHTRMLAEVDSDRRSELFNIILNGYDESDGRVAQLLKRAGYLEQRQSYCIVVAQPVNAAEMENAARAQRLLNAITDAMRGTSIRSLSGIRNGVATSILSDKRRQSGWTAPQANLAERIVPMLLSLGPVVLTGISMDHPSTSFLPKALNEAVTALDFATVANRVVQFGGLPIRDLLVHRGAGYVRSAAPSWAENFIHADAKTGGSLIQTLRAVADADMNLQKAARSLGKHPNTVYARIERIKEMTGRDGQSYHDLTELLLAADCCMM
jgi:PucR C-terminal helix-turn-helix domain/GGDEF-like domain